ncbi:ROK family transcriptional regulator [Streptomyces actuosus]|uniref:ROK family transcriptional regulator n=1 Tax=Streptomyces actuosus TaxID=1885 RepID=A0ABS2VX46_STRAS|nr:ROK family transcriptional regulator [Streptomyces actuosus]MBN0047701.1 ROK family transcriptional regulator [Streptomyces actuosus]
MPASPSTARAINDRLALRLLQRDGPLTAGQLKQQTGLSRPTVADLVERLTDAGLITVVGEAGEQRRGPNAKLYGIVADRAHLAALDVRTEGVAVVVCDLVGQVLAEASAPIGGETGTGPAVEQSVALVERVAKEAGAEELHTVGIGAPGLVDPASGELRDSTGLPEWHRRLVAAVQERLPAARVHVENETNLAALAEQRDGVARDRDTFVLLWLGGGTGAAVVLDGRLRRGASGGTGEIGFLPVPGTGTLPTATDCGGGFHSLAGAQAVADLAAAYGLHARATGGEPHAATLVRRAADDVAVDGTHLPVPGSGPGPGPGTAADRREAPGGPGRGGEEPAGHGPQVVDAAGFLDALADRVALGAASVVAVLDPGCVVLGGEVGQAGGSALAERVEQRLRRLSPLPTEVRPSALGGTAVLRGALLTARDRAQDELFTTGER